jgi:hypothetical protein
VATPLERMRTAWKTEGRLALHRAVEEMAREGVSRFALDQALDALLDEARAAGVDDDTEEDLLGVGDRLSGWCLASQRIVTREETLPTEDEIAKLPRWARVAFAARCARRVLPLFKHSLPEAPDYHSGTMENDVEVAELSAATAKAPARGGDIDGVVAAVEARTAGVPVAQAVARSATRAAKAAEVADSPFNFPDTTVPYEAVQAAAEAAPGVVPHIRRDFDHLVRLAEQSHWTDDTSVSPAVFGPLWPEGPPPGWPAMEAESDTHLNGPPKVPSSSSN